jgi:hypothetical protein
MKKEKRTLAPRPTAKESNPISISTSTSSPVQPPNKKTKMAIDCLLSSNDNFSEKKEEIL